MDVLFGRYLKASFMMFCAFLEEDVPMALLLCGCGRRLYCGDGATLSRLFDSYVVTLGFSELLFGTLGFSKGFCVLARRGNAIFCGTILG